MSRYKAKSLNREIRSQWPISILGVKALVILTHNLKEVWTYTYWVSRYKAKSLKREIRSQWPISLLGSKVMSYILIIWKKYENILIACQDIRQNHCILLKFLDFSEMDSYRWHCRSYLPQQRLLSTMDRNGWKINDYCLVDRSRCGRNDFCSWWTEVVDGHLSLLQRTQNLMS